MDRILPRHIHAILAVTDALGIHRESVAVPLAPRGDGAVQVTPADRVEITAPETQDFETWIERLPVLVRNLDLSRVRKAD